MRSGKDTVADYLVRHYGYIRIGFGDALRAVVRRIYPDMVTDRVAYRKHMQGVGQHMRQYDPDVWVNALLTTLTDELANGNTRFVISDMRQPNEYEALRTLGAMVALVDCSYNICAARAGAEAIMMSHETESHFVDFEYDFVLDNNGSKEQLHGQIDILATMLNQQEDAYR